jgi:hypothetical protein
VAERRTWILISLLMASAGVMVLALTIFGRREPDPVVATTKEPGPQSLGVRAAGADSARRVEAGEDVEQPLPALPAVAPVEVVDESSRPGPPPEPAVPIVPSAEDVAASDAAMEVMPRVKAEVEEAIESRRKSLRNACWNSVKLASATFPMEATFAADGGLLAFSIGEDRGAPEVGACIRSQPRSLVPLKIAAPGVPITVKVALTLP